MDFTTTTSPAPTLVHQHITLIMLPTLVKAAFLHVRLAPARPPASPAPSASGMDLSVPPPVQTDNLQTPPAISVRFVIRPA